MPLEADPPSLTDELERALDEATRRSTTATALRELTEQQELLRGAIVAEGDANRAVVAPVVTQAARIAAARAAAWEAMAETARKPIGWGVVSIEVRTLAAAGTLVLLFLAGLAWLGVDPITAVTEARRVYYGECVEAAAVPAESVEPPG